MKSMLNAMKKKNSGIPQDVLPLFEGIIHKYEGRIGSGDECDNEFNEAMEKHLTKEQRYWLYEQNGSCKGTGQDKGRKAFAQAHAHKPLAEKLELFNQAYGRNIILGDDNTITVAFACTHGFYKQAREKKILTPPPTIQSYFERCAGGRLYELHKALGIQLKIKSVDVSPLNEHILNPVVFVFEVIC